MGVAYFGIDPRTLPLHPGWLLAQDTIQRNVEKVFLTDSPDIAEILRNTQDELEERVY